MKLGKRIMVFPGSSFSKETASVQETWVQFLGQEDPLEKEMATHSFSCLENPMDRGAWQATRGSMGLQDSDTT